MFKKFKVGELIRVFDPYWAGTRMINCPAAVVLKECKKSRIVRVIEPCLKDYNQTVSYWSCYEY